MVPLNKSTFGLGLACFILLATFPIAWVFGQDAVIRYGRGVPPIVRVINNRSLNYLASTQNDLAICSYLLQSTSQSNLVRHGERSEPLEKKDFAARLQGPQHFL